MADFNLVEHTSPIPVIFHSDKHHKPFTHCKMCGKDVVNSGAPYMIEKAYGQDLSSGVRKVVFELAYCLDCLNEVNQSLSKESKQKIQHFFEENANMEKREAELKKYNLIDPEVWLHNCIFKNQSIDEVKEFQIYALCLGEEMLYQHAPYMVCGEAIDEIIGLLSNKSLDILNDLTADIIDLPPEFSELFKSKTPLIF